MQPLRRHNLFIRCSTQEAIYSLFGYTIKIYSLEHILKMAIKYNAYRNEAEGVVSAIPQKV